MAPALKIGWAARDITPRRPVLLRGLFNVRVATRVRDPLTTTALALDGGDDYAIIVSADICGVDDTVMAEARELIGKRIAGFDGDKLIISATHTHTGPFSGTGALSLQKEEEYLKDVRAKFPDYMTIAEYTRLLVDAIVAAACEAWETRREASMGFGYSYAVVGENRRMRYFDDRATMYGKTSEADFSHVEGHVDHSVNLLYTYTPDGKLTGALVNIACPSQSNEGGQDYISADFWHDVRNEIRSRLGEIFIVPQCSAAGDQSPHRLIATRAEDRMLKLKHGEGLSKGNNQALRFDIARRIADAVSDAEPHVRKDLQSSPLLRHVHRRLALPHWNVTDKEYNDVQAEIKRIEATLPTMASDDPLSARLTSAKSRINWCRRVVDRYENRPENIPIEMNVIRLGDMAFVTAPFEYYLDFGDRIKGRSPAVQTFVVQLAGGGTYLPTERAAAGCSYGAVPASCRVSPQGGQVIVEEAVKILTEMFAT